MTFFEGLAKSARDPCATLKIIPNATFIPHGRFFLKQQSSRCVQALRSELKIFHIFTLDNLGISLDGKSESYTDGENRFTRDPWPSVSLSLRPLFLHPSTFQAISPFLWPYALTPIHSLGIAILFLQTLLKGLTHRSESIFTTHMFYIYNWIEKFYQTLDSNSIQVFI